MKICQVELRGVARWRSGQIHLVESDCSISRSDTIRERRPLPPRDSLRLKIGLGGLTASNSIDATNVFKGREVSRDPGRWTMECPSMIAVRVALMEGVNGQDVQY